MDPRILSAFAVSFLLASAPAKAAVDSAQVFKGHRKIASIVPVLMTANVGGYSVEISGWGEPTGDSLDFGGNRDLTLINKDGEKVETKLVLNNNFSKLIADGSGNTYAVMVSTGEDLKKLGGAKGFAKFLGELLEKPVAATEEKKGDNFVFAAVDQNGAVKVFGSAKLKMQKR